MCIKNDTFNLLYKLVLVMTLILLIVNLLNNTEPFTFDINDPYAETYETDGVLPDGTVNALNILGIKKVEKNGTFFIPSDYNPCESQIKKLENENSTYFYLMDGCDIVGSKLDLWQTLRNVYGIQVATKYMPRSYLYSNNDDMKQLKQKINEYTGNPAYRPMYVLKNYEQRQEGLKLVRTWDEINSDENKKKFYLAQEYLYDPFIISGRKINMRVYLLLVCRNNKLEGYIYNNGFMYYTPELYDPTDISFNKHITTGYIDRQVYVENPLTIEDLREYLGKHKAHLLDFNIATLMNKICDALSTNVCKNQHFTNKVRFQVYGVDVAPQSDLSVKIMEINKGPDLGAKDKRDGEVKNNMQIDVFKIINPKYGSITGFKKIY